MTGQSLRRIQAAARASVERKTQMAKCRLGPKKLRALSALMGVPVAVAYVRGGWSHDVAEVWIGTAALGFPPIMVNRRTGVPLPGQVSEAKAFAAVLARASIS